VPRRIIAFLALAGVFAAVFVRLGVWQLGKHRVRVADNAVIASRLTQPELAWAALQSVDSARLRRTVVTGVPDTAAEFAITGRSRNGSPGVWLITPMRVAGSAEAVLVNRGWVYAPDAATVDLSRWREHRSTYHGFVQQLGRGPANVKEHSLRTLDSAGVDSLLTYPFSTLFLITQDSGHVDSIPARLPEPILDRGPFLNYAIQWFFFAAIAVAGAVFVALQSRDQKTVSYPRSHEPPTG